MNFYKKSMFKKYLVASVLLGLLIIFSIISLFIGEFNISVKDLIFGKINEKLKFILIILD